MFKIEVVRAVKLVCVCGFECGPEVEGTSRAFELLGAAVAHGKFCAGAAPSPVPAEEPKPKRRRRAPGEPSHVVIGTMVQRLTPEGLWVSDRVSVVHPDGAFECEYMLGRRWRPEELAEGEALRLPAGGES